MEAKDSASDCLNRAQGGAHPRTMGGRHKGHLKTDHHPSYHPHITSHPGRGSLLNALHRNKIETAYLHTTTTTRTSTTTNTTTTTTTDKASGRCLNIVYAATFCGCTKLGSTAQLDR